MITALEHTSDDTYIRNNHYVIKITRDILYDGTLDNPIQLPVYNQPDRNSHIDIKDNLKKSVCLVAVLSCIWS